MTGEEKAPRRLFPNMPLEDATELREDVRESGRQPTSAEVTEAHAHPFEPSGWPPITDDPEFEPGIYGQPVGVATSVTTPDLGIPVDLIETDIGWLARNAELGLFRGGYEADAVLRSFDDAVLERDAEGRLTHQWTKERLDERRDTVTRWQPHQEPEVRDE